MTKVYNANRNLLKSIKVKQMISDFVYIVSLSCGENFSKKMCTIFKILDKWRKTIHIDVIDEKAHLKNSSEIDDIMNITEKLQALNFVNLKTVDHLTVPQKRKRAKALLQNLLDICKHKSNIFNTKMYILEKVKQFWTEGKNFIVVKQSKPIVVMKKKVEINQTVIFSEQMKISRRPR